MLGSGGHSMAAGFRINRAHIPAFRTAFQEKVATLITNERERPAVVVEDYVGLDQVNVELVRDLYRLAPFGAGHPEPILASRQVRLVNVARMGRGGAHTRLVLEDRQGRQVQAVWWRKASREVSSDWVDAAFKLRLDDHQGEASVRLELVAVRAERIEAIRHQAESEKLPFVVVDQRGASERGLILQDLLQQHGLNIQVWAEDEEVLQLDRARARDRLEPGADLIIWSTPPGPQVVRSVLEKLRPRQVYLLTREGNPPSVTQFLRGLGGLVKSILIQRQGQTRLEELAARLGHREASVLQGMDYLVGMGKLRYRLFEGRIYIEARSAPGRQAAQGEVLKQLLQETAAYRRYFNQADAEQLLQVGE